MATRKDKKVVCPKCGAIIPTSVLVHGAACAWGRKGGSAGKGSPARHAAAIHAAQVRWGTVPPHDAVLPPKNNLK